MRNKDEQKDEIIREKAIEMIVKEGFDGLSMQKLAKAANISASTIYIYFKNREDLLNQLFIAVEQQFEKEALARFSPDISFEEGLWLQWKNRYRNILKHPMAYSFFEQFRHSPLIHKTARENVFGKTMNRFMQQAILKKELVDLPPEIIWAIAYGPFYTLVKFHQNQRTMAGKPFSLNEQKMKLAFKKVIKALKP